MLGRVMWVVNHVVDLDVEFQIKSLFIIIFLNKLKDFLNEAHFDQSVLYLYSNLMDVKYVGAFVRLAWVLVKAAI